MNHQRVLEAGEIIFSQGESADCAYLIESGKVQVLVRRHRRQVLLATLSPGDLLGEMALMDDKFRTATARAVVQTVLVPIPCDYMKQKLVQGDPTLRLFITVVMERYRDIHIRLMKVLGELSFIDGNVHWQSDAIGDLCPEALQERCSGIQSNILNAIHDISHHPHIRTSHEPESQHTRLMLKKENDLRKALENGELTLYYQPIVNIQEGFVSGLEALIRWNSPEHGVVPPFDFIPLAEKTGLIIPIGEWVIEKVCETAQAVIPRLSKRQKECFHFGINLSTRQFEGNELVDFISETIKKYKIDAGYLMLEVTESLLIEDPEYAQEQIEMLARLDAKIAIDDFGTGYSSFSYLHRFSFHTLKIDRAFISTMLTDPKSKSIVRALVQLAHNLGMDVIAEGIEEPEEFYELGVFGCDDAQGYYMSKPLALEEAVKLLPSTFIAQLPHAGNGG